MATAAERLDAQAKQIDQLTADLAETRTQLAELRFAVVLLVGVVPIDNIDIGATIDVALDAAADPQSE
jgi:hypothetical protein